MGTFAGHYGKTSIPKEYGQELTEQMLKLFKQGGMMDYEEVKIADIEINLLCPPKVDEEGNIYFSYNYFEDDCWESAGFNTKNLYVWSGKIGGHHFRRVMLAAYILAEFYSETLAITEVSGEVFDASFHIGWLNYLFGKEYTNKRSYDLWEIYKLLPEKQKDVDLTAIVRGDEVECFSLFAYINYLCYAKPDVIDEVIRQSNEINQKVSEIREASDRVSILDAVYLLKSSLIGIVSKSDDREEELHLLKEIMKTKSPECFKLCDDSTHNEFAMAEKMLPIETVLKFVADSFQVDLKKLLEEMLPVVPEKVPMFSRCEKPFPIVEPVPTNKFLLCSDDERAYFWQPEGDVVFSEEMKQWMVSLKEELDEIITDDSQGIPATEFFMVFTKTLETANEMYRHIFAFYDMYIEFIGHADRREYQAAVLLLQRLMERYSDEVEKLKKAYWPAEFKLPGRMEIKSYLAILANRQLRMNVFGF